MKLISSSSSAVLGSLRRSSHSLPVPSPPEQPGVRSQSPCTAILCAARAVCSGSARPGLASRYTTRSSRCFPGKMEAVSLGQKGLSSVPGMGVPWCAGLRPQRTLSAPAPAALRGHSLAGSAPPFAPRPGVRPRPRSAAGARRRRALWWPLASLRVCPSAPQGETRP